MKGFILIFSVCIICFSCGNDKPATTVKEEPAKIDTAGQTGQPLATLPFPGVDISPMDMSYFPTDYPKLKMAKATTEMPLARIIYSRPHLQGRRLFPNILKFGEPWRLGANEATELQLFTTANIQGKKISAGRYVLYCVPGPDNWTIVFNNNIDSWGLQPDSTRDIARFTIPVKQTPYKMEYFSMAFEKTNDGAELIMGWDTTEARLPISFK